MRALLGVAHNAFTEAIRQPIYIVLLLAVDALLVLNPAVTARHTISVTGDEFNKLLTDLGLSLLLISGLLLSAFVAAGVLAREIENKTVLTVVTKPIGRPLFLIGKYLGVLAAVALAYWGWAFVFLLTERHGVLHNASAPYHQPVLAFGALALVTSLLIALWCNYFYSWAFGATMAIALGLMMPLAYVAGLPFDHAWAGQPLGAELDARLGRLAFALLLILEALAVIVAISVAAATRLGQAMTLMVCAGVFMFGLSSDFFFGPYLDSSWLAQLAYALPFNAQFHWVAEALSQEKSVTLEYVGLVTAYSALYAIAAMAVGVALFQTREVS